MNSHLEEFCDHCAKKRGLKNSFVGLARAGGYARVICKGCGITDVDHAGKCLKCQRLPFTKGIVCLLILVLIIVLFI